MDSILEILAQPHNWYYAFSILLSVGLWALSLVGLSKSVGGDAGAGHFDWWHIWGLSSVPLVVSFTLLLLFQGGLGIVLNESLLPIVGRSLMGKWIVLIINFIVSGIGGLYLTGKAAKPLGFLFTDYGVPATAGNLIGRVAQVSSGKVTQSVGQAHLNATDGNTLQITIRVHEGELQYGDKILLTDFDDEKNIYWVAKYEE